MSVRGVALGQRFLGLLDAEFAPGHAASDGPPLIARERHVELARRLREELGFELFGFVVAMHYPAVEGAGESGEASTEVIRVSYCLRTVGKGSELAMWQLEAPVGEAVPTLAHLFAGADWQEREQYDLLGVRFEGHPDLRRLMLPEDWAGHPLRKDYAIDTQVPPWR